MESAGAKLDALICYEQSADYWRDRAQCHYEAHSADIFGKLNPEFAAVRGKSGHLHGRPNGNERGSAGFDGDVGRQRCFRCAEQTLLQQDLGDGLSHHQELA